MHVMKYQSLWKWKTGGGASGVIMTDAFAFGLQSELQSTTLNWKVGNVQEYLNTTGTLRLVAMGLPAFTRHRPSRAICSFAGLGGVVEWKFWHDKTRFDNVQSFSLLNIATSTTGFPFSPGSTTYWLINISSFLQQNPPAVAVHINNFTRHQDPSKYIDMQNTWCTKKILLSLYFWFSTYKSIS